MIDDKWFKQQQRRVGVTTEDIAARAGRARSAVSNIYTGRQRMNLDWAKVFAEVLQVPLDEVLQRAGAMDAPTARHLSPGFSEGDVQPWENASSDRGGDRRGATAQRMGEAAGARPGVDIWHVKTNALALQGYLPGDFVLADTHAADSARAGDVVIAQIYDNSKGKAITVLRRYEPPVLVSASANPDDRRVFVVDGSNVLIRAKIVASWRT